MVEHRTENAGVAGSIPALGTHRRRGGKGGRQAAYRATYARWRQLDDSTFAASVARQYYAGDVLRELGFQLTGGNYAAVKRHVARLGLDTSHWKHGRPFMGKPLEAVLTPGGYTNRTALKKRMLAAGRLTNQCAICGMAPTWNGQPLVLVLDHVNGVSDDYREENLRLVCPNCNSQLPTHAGRNAGRARRGGRA